MPKPFTLTVEDGLGFRDIKAIGQDSRGLMWFGTKQGLERYDGLRFVKYGSDGQADFPFPNENVSSEDLLVVNDSSLWVLANRVLYELNLRTQQATNLSVAADLPGEAYSLRQASDGTIWVVTDDGQVQSLWRHEGQRRFRAVATAQHLRMPFNDVAFDRAGNAWWSTIVEGLRLFGPSGELLHEVKPDSFVWDNTKMYFSNISTDNQGNLFVFPKSSNAIWQYDSQTRQHEVLADDLANRVYLLLEDTRGNHWFATYDGLLRRNPAGEWADFTATLHAGFQFTNITHLYEDRTHLLWVATDNGLLRFPIGRDMFQTYLAVPGKAWGNAMRGIVANDEGLALAYCENGEQGLHQIDVARESTQRIFPFHDSLSLLPMTLEMDNLVLGKKKNVAWAINDKLLKISISGKQGSVEGKFADVSSKWSRNPLCLLRDGTIVLGSELKKLTRYDPLRRQRSSLFAKGTDHLPNTPSLVIMEGGGGTIWVGTESAGLFCFGREGETLAHFTTKTTPALSKDHVLALLFDCTGKLWVGTFGGGLNCLELPAALTDFANQPKLNIRVFTQQQGLSDNNVVSLQEDDDGNIWAGTFNGLSCYRVSEQAFRNFYEEDGLTNNEFNYASSFKDGQGGMWFGGMNGINYFAPQDILQAEQNPPLCLTGFTKYNKLTDSTVTQVIGSEEIGRFFISPYDSWFQFSWALPNYFKPDKNHYYVQLEGLENDWSYLGSTPFVRFNTLADGNYTLRVKASDSKGNWSEAELVIPITVRPFFYQTWWFYLLVLALVGGIGFGISRARYRRRLEVEKMRTQIASDLHDEVGSMLSGLAMQAEILEIQGSAADTSSLAYLKDVSRTAVGKMRDMVWSIDSRRDRMQDLLDRMREHAEETFPLFDISHEFETEGLRLAQKLPVDVRQHLYLIFREAVTNICKHAKADRVKIFFGNRDGHAVLSVWDNGQGLRQGKPSTGLGLSNMRLRAKALGADFSLENQQGLVVKIRLKTQL